MVLHGVCSPSLQQETQLCSATGAPGGHWLKGSDSYLIFNFESFALLRCLLPLPGNFERFFPFVCFVLFWFAFWKSRKGPKPLIELKIRKAIKKRSTTGCRVIKKNSVRQEARSRGSHEKLVCGHSQKSRD